MADALLVGRLVVAVGHVRAPIASLWTKGIEQPLDMRREIAERIDFRGVVWRRRQLDRDVWIFGERSGLADRVCDPAFLGGVAADAHVVGNQLQTWITLRNAGKLRIL